MYVNQKKNICRELNKQYTHFVYLKQCNRFIALSYLLVVKIEELGNKNIR